jgi:CMP-N,N'-diacetyllegionaminic acid synthase
MYRKILQNSMGNRLNILSVITARGGSKGIPRKNIKKLGDRPLIAYTIDAAKKSDLITNLIISTDDKEIADVARKYGADAPFIRPKELSEDSTPHLPVIRHAISFMEDKLGTVFDYVVILQPTSPFRTKEDLDGTIQKLIDTGADSAVSLVEIEENHPVKIKKLEGDRVLPYSVEEVAGTRRQDLPVAYKRSGAVYAIKRDLIMEKNELYGEYTVGHIVPKDRSIDIDSPFDWLKAEYMLNNLKKKGEI